MVIPTTVQCTGLFHRPNLFCHPQLNALHSANQALEILLSQPHPDPHHRQRHTRLYLDSHVVIDRGEDLDDPGDARNDHGRPPGEEKIPFQTSNGVLDLRDSLMVAGTGYPLGGSCRSLRLREVQASGGGPMVSGAPSKIDFIVIIP